LSAPANQHAARKTERRGQSHTHCGARPLEQAFRSLPRYAESQRRARQRSLFGEHTQHLLLPRGQCVDLRDYPCILGFVNDVRPRVGMFPLCNQSRQMPALSRGRTMLIRANAGGNRHEPRQQPLWINTCPVRCRPK
jgi:hypothetical protein